MGLQRRKSVAGGRVFALLREYKANAAPVESLAPLGAHAVGIGRKFVKGKPTNKLALRFYVAKKRPKRRLGSGESIPETVRFFSRMAQREVNLSTDLIEMPPAQFEAVDPETRIRPVPGGVSGGISGTTGTIGGWVWDNTDDSIVMLSNDHVFGNTAGVDTLQQGTADGGSLPADKIGDVKRGIARSATATNRVDCAIGDPDDSEIYDLQVLEIGPAVFALDVAVLDMLVEKYGQTTRHTFGEIQDVDWSGTVSGLPFEDCLLVDIVPPSTDWSAGGDSGSLVFSQTVAPDTDIKPVVGLHFAGSGTTGIECKIQNVFSALDLNTLCAGAFSAFLDALFETESEGEISTETEARLLAISALATRTPTRVSPLSFARKERAKCRARTFHSGMARDVQKRLQASKSGRIVVNFVDKNRSELLTLLTKEGDVRRATVAALGPLLRGATTTTDVLKRVLLAQDLDRLDKLAREVRRHAGRKLGTALRIMTSLKAKGEGKSLATILGIKL